MLRASADLFGQMPAQRLPLGLKYQPEVIEPREESELIRLIGQMPLKEFEFQGFRGKRRVVSFGWRRLPTPQMSATLPTRQRPAMQLPTIKAVTNGVNIGQSSTLVVQLEVPPCWMAELPEAEGGLVRLGPHVPLRLGVAQSVAIVCVKRNRAQRQNGRQE